MMRQWLESILIINTTMKKETPKNGPHTEYYENGQKESEEYYKDGECISGDC